MSAAAFPKLTERQRDVMERIDRRVPIKVIAGDLQVSEARINQHIRALKDKLSAESMNELVEQYRAFPDYENSLISDSYSAGEGAEEASEDPYRNSLYRKSQLHEQPESVDQSSRGDPGEIVLSDVHHVLIDAPWAEPREPVVVPPLFDGDNAVLYRLAAIIGIAFLTASAVILAVSAAVSMSEVLDGKASIHSDLSNP